MKSEEHAELKFHTKKKKKHSVLFHLYEVLEQVKILYQKQKSSLPMAGVEGD